MLTTASPLIMLCRIFCLFIDSVPQITGNIECYKVKRYRKVTRKHNFIDHVTGELGWLSSKHTILFICIHWKEWCHNGIKVLIFFSEISLIRNPFFSSKEYSNASFTSVTQHIRHVRIDTAWSQRRKIKNNVELKTQYWTVELKLRHTDTNITGITGKPEGNP